MNEIVIKKKNPKVWCQLAQIAEENGMALYAVGGTLRDWLMGKESKDDDFLALGDAVLMANKASAALNGSKVVEFPRFNTAFFMLDDVKMEFTGLRINIENSSESEAVTEDLRRRDFTINAVSARLNAGGEITLFDPIGGIDDIKKGLLRTPMEAETIFKDDPVRILRAFRFAAQFKLKIHPFIPPAMKAAVEGLKNTAWERIGEEFLKILALPKPSLALKPMFDIGVYDQILPELSCLSGVERHGRHHHKDVFLHTLKVVDNAAVSGGDVVTRFAALFHDIAKPLTKKFDQETGYTFHGHEDLGSRMVYQIAMRLRLPRETAKLAQKLTLMHMRPVNLAGTEVTDSAIRRLMTQAGDDLDRLLILCRADITSGDQRKVKQYLKNFDFMVQRTGEVSDKDEMLAFQSPLRGGEIMELCGIEPGPLVGKIKKAIEEAILSGEIPNEYDAAKEYFFLHKEEWLKVKV
ncbi:HD domain-containing protein [bacterium]|nr:HD domain-containing protein [bacterium]